MNFDYWISADDGEEGEDSRIILSVWHDSQVEINCNVPSAVCLTWWTGVELQVGCWSSHEATRADSKSGRFMCLGNGKERPQGQVTRPSSFSLAIIFIQIGHIIWSGFLCKRLHTKYKKKGNVIEESNKFSIKQVIYLSIMLASLFSISFHTWGNW
jgi:hypothetical protein